MYTRIYNYINSTLWKVVLDSITGVGLHYDIIALSPILPGLVQLNAKLFLIFLFLCYYCLDRMAPILLTLYISCYYVTNTILSEKLKSWPIIWMPTFSLFLSGYSLFTYTHFAYPLFSCLRIKWHFIYFNLIIYFYIKFFFLYFFAYTIKLFSSELILTVSSLKVCLVFVCTKTTYFINWKRCLFI